MDVAVAGERTSYNDMREKTVRYIVFQMDRYLRSRTPKPRDLASKIKMAAAKYCCLVCTQMKGSYMVTIYLFCKILYLANAVGQLFLLDMFLGKEFHFYGIDVIYRLIHGRDWLSSERFPRVTMCDFEIRHMTQIHRYIVQCTLPINIFNEKLFIVIWFWFATLTILTAYSFFWWAWHICYWRNHYKFIKRNLKISHPEVPKRQKQNLMKFTELYLQRDGFFVLKLISQTVGVMSTADIVQGLWENYGPDKRALSDQTLSLNAGSNPLRPGSRSPSFNNIPVIRVSREEV